MKDLLDKIGGAILFVAYCIWFYGFIVWRKKDEKHF